MAKTVLHIVLDDWMWVNELLVTGQTTMSDKFQSHGIKFTRHRPAGDVRCGPNRMSLFTGQTPRTHTVIDNDWGGSGGQSDLSTTIFTALSNAGWLCAFYGKFNNGWAGCDNAERADCTTIPLGLDRATFNGFKSNGEYIGDATNSNTYNLYVWDGLTGRNTVTEAHTTDDLGNSNAATDYTTDLLAFRADAHLRDNTKIPFATDAYLYVAFKAIHDEGGGLGPRPAARHNSATVGTWKTQTPRPADSWNLVDSAAIGVDGDGTHPEMIYSLPSIDPTPGPVSLNAYFRTMQSVDEAILKLLNAITAVRDINNTIVIIHSDNGFMLGELRVLTGKSLPYWPSRALPTYVYAPGIATGTPRSVDSLIQTHDIPVTIADWAGTTVPNAEGTSFLGKISGDGSGSGGRSAAMMHNLMVVESGGETASPWIMVEQDDGHWFAKYPYGDLADVDPTRAPFFEWYKPTDTGEQSNRYGVVADAAKQAELEGLFTSMQGGLDGRMLPTPIGKHEADSAQSSATITVTKTCPVGYHIQACIFANTSGGTANVTTCDMSTSGQAAVNAEAVGGDIPGAAIWTCSTKLTAQLNSGVGTVTVTWRQTPGGSTGTCTERRIYLYLVRNMKQTGWFNKQTATSAQSGTLYPKTNPHTTDQTGELVMCLISVPNAGGAIAEGVGWNQDNRYPSGGTLRHVAVQWAVTFVPDSFIGTGKLDSAVNSRSMTVSYFQEPAASSGTGGGSMGLMGVGR